MSNFETSILCDYYSELLDVVEPIFSNFGGVDSFSGEVVTVKCFEDNGLLYGILETDGTDKVLVVDGGGSLRKGILDAELVDIAVENNWSGIVIYGAVRNVDYLASLDIGIQALAATPAGVDAKGEGIKEIGVNFGGVTFLTGDYIYADNTGIVLSEDELDLSFEEPIDDGE